MSGRRFRIYLCGVLMGVALSLASWGAAAVDIIANPAVSVSALSITSARSMFGMRQARWPDGTPVRVFVLADGQPLHIAFCKEVLGVFPYQLRQSWDRLVYSGTGQAPVEVVSEEQMLALVAATPGAIGYVKKVNDHDAVRAIPVR